MAQLSLHISDEEHRHIKMLAAANGLSIKDLILTKIGIKKNDEGNDDNYMLKDSSTSSSYVSSDDDLTLEDILNDTDYTYYNSIEEAANAFGIQL